MTSIKTSLFAMSAANPGVSDILDPDAIYTTEETALRVKSTPRTLEAWRLQGIGPPYIRLGRRMVRYRGKDVLEFLSGKTFTSTSEEATRAA